MKINHNAAIALALSLIFILTAGIYFVNYFPTTSQVSTACFKEKCFEVELAATAEQQAQGLSNRSSLGGNKAMLFVFQNEEIRPFWMKGMKFPLDIIWISSNGTVVFIERNAQPCGMAPCVPINPRVNSKYVLEVNAGVANTTNLALGDAVSIT